MCQLDMLVYSLLDEVAVLLVLRLGNDVPYKLLNAGVDVLLAVARHCRIFGR